MPRQRLLMIQIFARIQRPGGGMPTASDWSIGALFRGCYELRSPCDDPLDDSEIRLIREDLLFFLSDQGFHSSLTVSPGQPLMLDLRRDLLALTGDVDPGFTLFSEMAFPNWMIQPHPATLMDLALVQRC